jgi:hypothetical protein
MSDFGKRFHPTPVQLMGFTIYLFGTLLALWVSLSEIKGDGLVIIVMCCPAILLGMLLMALGGKR